MTGQRFCPRCGEKIGYDAEQHYCMFCGNFCMPSKGALGATETQAPKMDEEVWAGTTKTIKYCPYCRAELAAGQTSCSSCGRQIPGVSRTPAVSGTNCPPEPQATNVRTSEKRQEQSDVTLKSNQPPHRESRLIPYLKYSVIGFLLVAAMAVSLVFLRGGDSSHESKQPAPISYPQELEGNYMVRKMNGNDDMNATIKVYYEGEGYAMNVYSSMTTRKYTFSYNPSTGEIDSEVLGKGRARIKEYTNETEITFEGWEIVK